MNGKLGKFKMNVSDTIVLIGAVSTILGVLFSSIVGFILVRAQRRKENSQAILNEASAENTGAKTGIELSDAAMRLLKSVQDELARTKDEIATLRKQIEDVSSENVKLRREKESLEQRVNDLEVENAELRRKVANLENGSNPKEDSNE